jgi:hypothetical protein
MMFRQHGFVRQYQESAPRDRFCALRTEKANHQIVFCSRALEARMQEVRYADLLHPYALKSLMSLRDISDGKHMMFRQLDVVRLYQESAPRARFCALRTEKTNHQIVPCSHTP